MCEALARGEELPIDPKDATIYYVGPTPAKPGQVIGSAGPTTSSRVDKYAPALLDLGQTGMIGKGRRSEEVIASMKKNSAVYIGTNVEYAPFVENGSRNNTPKPFLKPAATEHAEEYKKIMTEAMKNA